jgi:ribosomal protein L16 Arg81 hydroxylase
MGNWKEHMDQYRKRPPHQRPMECTVYPGDVAFVPHGWWHMVINLDDRNIAITHNYVSPSNLGNVLKLFSEKQDQISGCRDREETVKPEQLYDEFTKVLQEKEPINLEKALSQKDWTCRAWNDGLDAKENNQPSATICKKRPLDDAGNGAHERKSIMTKTENVAAFTFSFL